MSNNGYKGRKTCAVRPWTIACLIPLLFIGSTASYAFAQPSADDGPEVTGPLVQVEEPRCEEDDIKDPDGEVWATQTWCKRSYQYPAAAETDVAHDYGARWGTLSIDPVPGMCVSRAYARVSVDPEMMAVVSSTRPHHLRAKRSRSLTSRLRIEPPGATSASLRQSYTLRRGHLQSWEVTEQGKAVTVWSGSTSKKVFVTVGPGYSHPVPVDPTAVFETGWKAFGTVGKC